MDFRPKSWKMSSSRSTSTTLIQMKERVQHVLTVENFRNRIEEFSSKKEWTRSNEFSVEIPAATESDRRAAAEIASGESGAEEAARCKIRFCLEFRVEKFEIYDNNGRLLQTNKPFLSLRVTLACPSIFQSSANNSNVDENCSRLGKGSSCTFGIGVPGRDPIHEVTDARLVTPTSPSGSGIWSVRKFVPVEALAKEPARYLDPVSGALSLTCKLVLVLGERTVDHTPVPLAADPGRRLNERLRPDAFPDLTLVVEGDRLPCHKHMMAAASDVFAAMLSMEKGKEAEEGEVNIPDFGLVPVEVMLDYVYSDDLSLSPEQTADKELLAEVVYIAEKYQILGLKVKAVEAALAILDVGNVSDFLVLGDRVSSERLKASCVTFATENIVSVRKTDSWARLSREHGGLVDEILGELL